MVGWRHGDHVRNVRFVDHRGEHTISARTFVDASGDRDLACPAGASTRYGNNGVVNLGTLGTRFGGVAADANISAEVVAYPASADYDPREARNITRAEAAGRQQASTDLEILRGLQGWERAYLASIGREFGTQESRRINSVAQLTWRQVTARRRGADCVALGAWGVEWHDRDVS